MSLFDDDVFDVRECRRCGCTDDAACLPTCWWVEADLCSRCADLEHAAVILDAARALPSPIGMCQNCQRPIEHGQPYMGRIPFVGSFGGFVHRHCRPVLQVLQGGAADG